MFGFTKGIFFSRCVGCEKLFERLDLMTGELSPAVSEYPICMGCLGRGQQDRKEWVRLKQKIHELTNNRNNTKTSSLPEPKKVSD